MVVKNFDHTFFNINKPNSRLLKLRLELEEYDYEIKYTKGSDNLVADALSRVKFNINF